MMSICRGAALFLLVFFRFSLVTAAECGSDGRVALPIGLFTSRDVLRTSSAIPAARLAIQQINEDGTILPGYCLKEVVYDTDVRQIAACFNESLYSLIGRGLRTLIYIASTCLKKLPDRAMI